MAEKLPVYVLINEIQHLSTIEKKEVKIPVKKYKQ